MAEAEEDFFAIGVDADVFAVEGSLGLGVGVAEVGDGAAGKVEGMVAAIGDDLDDVGVVDVLVGAEGGGKGGQVGMLIGLDEFDEAVDVSGIDFGFVALDVDDDVDGAGGDGFGDTVGAAAMVGAGKAPGGVELITGVTDELMVGGDDDLVDEAGLADLLVDVLDEVLAGFSGENFSGESR